MKSPTAFQKKVYAAVRRIPRGRVTTYRLLAECIGCRSCRAVGQALRRNPFAPAVPCHRVIASDLRIGGFSGKRSGREVVRKRKLLESEGVRFRAGRLREPSRVFRFTG
ncbi:MAG: MGMT family protein [Lentisphaerae bacterium]|nr:MGMT family protein [Lentisphaerota bacterium]